MADFLPEGGTDRTTLRHLVDVAVCDGKPLVLPGCYDALSARLVEQAGFDAVYMTGFGTTASLLGRPDVGLLGMSEMVDNARRIAGAVAIPLLADADTGYGNQINVIRTVQAYEQAGVGGIHIEDQVLPKKCGHMENKQVVDAATMRAKVAAAAAARRSDEFLLVARTDARAPLGLDEAIRRGHACAEAGADVLFIEALQTEDEIQQVAAEFSGVPLLFNWVEGGAKTPDLTYDDIAELGFALIINPIGTLLTATAALQDFLTQLHQAGTPAPMNHQLMGFDAFTETIGLDEIVNLEQRFAD